ncbi:MAG: saccharopine dehydrogenase [Leptolyngbya sp. RL_3_1]|nr:saccharopine dehydrogenase [Leptolyngbya sp. RL_3_1]
MVAKGFAPVAPYDLVVFGATGFVGKIVCQYLLDTVGVAGDLRWAIAGRSIPKLEQLVKDLGPHTALPVCVADAADEATLRDLCAQTRVVISTVGPYARYGEPLVKVCAETGTDYCDLTGEAQWVRRMVQTYGALAQRSGARIVHCCGFDSIPSDLGVYALQHQAQRRFGQPCQRVKMRVKAAQGGISGGTIASGINLVKEAAANPALRQEWANPYSLCLDLQTVQTAQTAKTHPPTLIPVQYDAAFQAWVTPFVMAEINTRIVLRSQGLLEQADGAPLTYGPNFQYDEGILTGTGIVGGLVAHALKISLTGLGIAAALGPTRWLLEQTIVPAPGAGPSPAAQAEGFYDLRFWGETATGQTLELKVTGDRDPGYGSTAKILGQAGLCLAQDCPKTAKPGGFWTPATLFGEGLIDRLINQAGLTFAVREAHMGAFSSL